MQQLKKILTFIFLVSVTLSWSQSMVSDTTKILFIGNSYTYYNSLPELVKGMAQEKFPNQVIETQLVSQGGMTLKRHWEEEKSIQAIRSGHWDYVVLQEQSKLGMGVVIDDDFYFGQTDLFYEYARKFDEEIKKVDAKTVFFMTWSRSDNPEEQEILTYAYSSIAKELDAILAPVGLAWDQLRTNTTFNLYVADGSHPSPMGSYLAASAIFSTLFEVSPLGLSGKVYGKILSSSGAPSIETKSLTAISMADAQAIQTASWSVVKALQKSGDYPNVEQPKPSYNIPVLPEGENIDIKNITGKWYGTSTYGFNYLGIILEASYVDNKLEVNLNFYTPDRKDTMIVQEAKLEKNRLVLKIFDSLRNMNATIQFSLDNNQMIGILESVGPITRYNHLKLSRKNIQNDFDMAAFDLQMQAFQSDIVKDGYVKAAINHYKKYSLLIGKTYIPEESYLNTQGYNGIRDNKMNDALNLFELAMTLYPQSVNTYDSYGEALVKAGQNEKALKIYAEGYELAKKTGDKNLPIIEANLKKLKENAPIKESARILPPPPPRQ
jgi:tetratricopeptide (TPR) repeat protein